MSGRADPRRSGSASPPARVQLSLLDRLIDDQPERSHDMPLSSSDVMAELRKSVRRDLEQLLNARRRWRSWPAGYTELATSPVGYGIPDCTAGSFNDQREREALRFDIEATIRRFEPRFVSVSVTLLERENKLDSTLRLRIEALLHADPAPEPMTFDTSVDATTADVTVRSLEDA